MEHFTFKSFGAFMNEVRHMLVRGFHGVLALPWPAVLLVCLGLALVLSILPLALTLFVVVLVFKFIYSMFTPPAKPDPKMLSGGDQT